MNVINSFYGEIEAESLQLNNNELTSRLSVPRYYTHQCIKECQKQLLLHIDAKYSVAEVTVEYFENSVFDLGLGKIASKNLYNLLYPNNSAFVVAVTLGHSVDRLLNTLSATGTAEHFITDALASAYAEALCDEVCRKISKGNTYGKRYSPGYGDLSLSVQPQLLELVNAQRLLGVTLSESLLMSPTKTITAIMEI